MSDTKKPATYDDLVKLPEHVVGEIIDGELFVSPRPASPHARAASCMGGDLHRPFDGPPGGSGGPGGWWILIEPELHFGKNVLVPDWAGWRCERMPRIPKVAAFELPPDWVCEVISPSTAKLDRGRKLRVYAKVGVAWHWIVDPLAKTLEIFRLENGRWSLLAVHTDAEKVRAEPFEAIEIELGRWWLEE